LCTSFSYGMRVFMIVAVTRSSVSLCVFGAPLQPSGYCFTIDCFTFGSVSRTCILTPDMGLAVARPPLSHQSFSLRSSSFSILWRGGKHEKGEMWARLVQSLLSTWSAYVQIVYLPSLHHTSKMVPVSKTRASFFGREGQSQLKWRPMPLTTASTTILLPSSHLTVQ
jgi:hypothetical protein